MRVDLSGWRQLYHELYKNYPGVNWREVTFLGATGDGCGRGRASGEERLGDLDFTRVKTKILIMAMHDIHKYEKKNALL